MKAIACLAVVLLSCCAVQAQQIRLVILPPGEPAPQGYTLTLSPAGVAVLGQAPRSTLRLASGTASTPMTVSINAPTEPNLPPPVVGPVPTPGPSPTPAPTPIPLPVAPVPPIVIPVTPAPQPNVIVITPTRIRCRLFGRIGY